MPFCDFRVSQPTFITSLVNARSAEVLNLFSSVFVSICRQALNLPIPCEYRAYMAT